MARKVKNVLAAPLTALIVALIVWAVVRVLGGH